MSNEIDVKTNNEVALIDDQFLSEIAGMGLQSVDTSELRLPYIKILQDMSDQVKKDKAAYVPGAESGMFFNTSTKELLPSEITVIPVNVEQKLIELKPKTMSDKFSQFVEDHSNNMGYWAQAKFDEQKNAYFLPNGNIIEKTWKFLLLILKDDGSTRPAFLHLRVGQRKAGIEWYNMLMQTQAKLSNGTVLSPPSVFYTVYSLKTVTENGVKGDFKTIAMSPKCETLSLENGQFLFKAAHKLAKSYLSGLTTEQKEDFSDSSIDDVQEPEIKKADPKNLF